MKSNRRGVFGILYWVLSRRRKSEVGCQMSDVKCRKSKVRVFGKRGIVSEALPWILISIAILAILMVAILVMKDKGVSIIDRIKDVFKFR